MTTHKKQETEPSIRILSRSTYKQVFGMLSLRNAVGIFVFLGLIIPLSFAVAYVHNATGSDNSYTMTSDHAPSLSSLDLLDPVQTPDQVLAVGGGSVEIIEGILLRAETSPAGDTDGTIWVDSRGQVAKYLVRPGDTPSEIAETYGISVETILAHNNISSDDHVIAGDILEILPVDGVQHTVVAGDTIESLAQQYNVEIQDIIAINTIGATLEADDKIIIPGAQETSVQRPQTTKSRVKVTAQGHDLGEYIFPCDCIVTQGYGDTKFARASSYYKSHWHGGVDFSSSRGTGTPIVAIDGGTVTAVKNSGHNGGYGLYVKITHDTGVEALYAHNSSNTVSVGQRVEQGQIIGYMGTTGRVTGPHVHMEITGDNPFYELFQGSYGY
jgi:LysM repeat protein